MRIISQDRNISVEFDNVILKICNSSLIYAYPYANQSEVIVLGKYASQERAREVFEDIHKAYAPVYSISNNLSEAEITDMLLPSNNVMARNILNTGCEMCLTTYGDYVYSMPEE